MEKPAETSTAGNDPVDKAVEAPVTGLRRLDHFAVHVTDLERSAAFYKRVFGFELVHKFTTTWMVGNDSIRVGLFLRPEAKPVENPDQLAVIQHVAFLTDKDGFEKAVKQLDVLKVPHEEPDDSGIAFSVFVNDPDGHLLEITYYYQNVPAC